MFGIQLDSTDRVVVLEIPMFFDPCWGGDLWCERRTTSAVAGCFWMLWKPYHPLKFGNIVLEFLVKLEIFSDTFLPRSSGSSWAPPLWGFRKHCFFSFLKIVKNSHSSMSWHSMSRVADARGTECFYDQCGRTIREALEALPPSQIWEYRFLISFEIWNIFRYIFLKSSESSYAPPPWGVGKFRFFILLKIKNFPHPSKSLKSEFMVDYRAADRR